MKSPLQGVLVDGEVAMTLEEAMEKVWRQALVEGAAEVELDGKRFAVRETPRKRLREVDLSLRAAAKGAGAESENGIALGAIGARGTQGDAISFGGAVPRGGSRWKSDAVWREEEKCELETRN